MTVLRQRSGASLYGLAAFAMMVTASGLGIPGAAGAQPNSGNRAAPICMVREARTDGRPLSIVLPASDVAAMQANGFALVPCREAFASRDAILQWRDKACQMAADRNERMQELVENRFGVRPAVFCGMAESAVGSWPRALSGER